MDSSRFLGTGMSSSYTRDLNTFSESLLALFWDKYKSVALGDET